MNTMDGCMALAAANTDLIVFSDSPDHLLSTALGVMDSRTRPLSAAS